MYYIDGMCACICCHGDVSCVCTSGIVLRFVMCNFNWPELKKALWIHIVCVFHYEGVLIYKL